MKEDSSLPSELSIKIRQGDTEAFEILFKKYHKQLCHYAMVYVGHSGIADDIVQETFISIWNSREQLNPEKSLNAYLYRCVHNQCLNYITKAKSDRRLSDNYFEEMSYRATLLGSDLSDSYFDELANEELKTIVIKAVNELPAQCREVFVLSRYQELTYAQIAEKLFISINTVKTQLSRALNKIREALDKK